MKGFLTDHLTAVLVYLLIINLIAFIVYGIDKRRAKRKRWRIPEITLIMFSALGGGIGSLAGMFFWHHKTKKLKFLFAVPTLIILWITAAICIFTL
ncbi:MAG: DUF1294 domain-containing protein [Ruminococcus sp.]|nr:DUF1294 domain-containing protein [Ruminococcus sp.]